MNEIKAIVLTNKEYNQMIQKIIQKHQELNFNKEIKFIERLDYDPTIPSIYIKTLNGEFYITPSGIIENKEKYIIKYQPNLYVEYLGLQKLKEVNEKPKTYWYDIFD